MTITHSVLKNALNMAVYPWGLIKQNPMLYVKIPKYEERPTTKKDLKIISLGDFDHMLEITPEGHPFYIPLYGKLYIDSNAVCTKEDGGLVTPSVVKWNTRRISNALSLSFNFHSLRHTHATLLLENGAKMKEISERLGHSRISITMDTYSHVTDKMRNQTVDIMVFKQTLLLLTFFFIHFQNGHEGFLRNFD